jgi:hypothetical protein
MIRLMMPSMTAVLEYSHLLTTEEAVPVLLLHYQ